MASVQEFRDFSNDVVESLDMVQEEGWNENVQHVIVILSASRSGSSLVFNALSTSPDIIAPAGEHEPWLFLSENKFPFLSSDQILGLENTDLLLNLIRNDLLVRSDEVESHEYLTLLSNRMRIRGLSVPDRVRDEILTDETVSAVVHQYFQRHNFGIDQHLPPPTSDVQLRDGEHIYPVENPPYIDIPLARRATMEELASGTLLFKSPSDAYRPGMYEQLFPYARIEYIHLTRGYAQTINGIMDGWLAGESAFISNGVGLTGARLNIDGYTSNDQSEAYWCFDLFPDWANYKASSLLTIGALQWVSAHRAILEDFDTIGRVKFEGLYADQQSFISQLEEVTGTTTDRSIWEVPVMATHAPRQARWRAREGIFSRIGELVHADVADQLVAVNHDLGYSEDPDTWL